MKHSPQCESIAMFVTPLYCDMTHRSQESTSIAQPPKVSVETHSTSCYTGSSKSFTAQVEHFCSTDIPIGYHHIGFNLVTRCNELLTVDIRETDTLWYQSGC